MKWPGMVLTLCTIIACVSIASQTASAQTFGGYGAGFVPSPQPVYNGYGQYIGVAPPVYPSSYYSPGFVVGSYGGFGGYGISSQAALWQYQRNGWSSMIAFSVNRPAFGNGFKRHRHRRHCDCGR